MVKTHGLTHISLAVRYVADPDGYEIEIMVFLPGALGNQGDITWQGIGPGGGGAWLGVGIHPVDPNKVLIGTDVAGVYRTENGGLSWTNANVGLADRFFKSQAYWNETFAFDPGDPNVVYGVGGGGVHRSDDGGNTWNTTIGGSDLFDISAIAVDPETPNIVYAVSGSLLNFQPGTGCIYKSQDRFNTFIPIPFTSAATCSTCDKPNAFSILIDPLIATNESERRLLISTNNGLFRSDDSGKSWRQIDTGITYQSQPYNDYGQMALAHDASTNSVRVYMTVHTKVPDPLPGEGYVDPQSWVGGVYQSDDWGEHWLDITNGIDLDFLFPFYNGNFDDPSPGSPAPHWTFYGDDGTLVTRDSTVYRSSPYSIRISTPDPFRGGPGILSELFPIQPGSRYEISAFAKVAQGAGLPDSCCTFFGRVLYFNDAEPIQPVHESRCSLSPFENLWGARDKDFGWRKYATVITAPPGATRAQLVLYTFDTQGTTWIDDVSVAPTRGLPRTSSASSIHPASNYQAIVADDVNPGIVYVGTYGALNTNGGQYEGVWKRSSGGWTHVTRHLHADNVLDGRANTESTGPDDRSDCGHGYAYDAIHGLGIGSGPQGHETLYMTSVFFMYKTTDGGITWEEPTSEPDPSSPPEPNCPKDPNCPTIPTCPNACPMDPQCVDDPGHPVIQKRWKARGNTNNVVTHDVAMDPLNPQRLYYGDEDNLLLISENGGSTFRQEGIDRGLFLWDQCPLNTVGGEVPSIVADSSRVYVSVGSGAETGGALSDDLTDPAWVWQVVGTGYPLGRGVLALDTESQTLYAGVYGKGVFKNDTVGGPWVSLVDSGHVWNPRPPVFNPHRIVIDQARGRIFVGLGDPSADSAIVPGDPSTDPSSIGLWMSRDGGANWCKINSPEMDNEPILSVVIGSAGEVYAGTWNRKDPSQGGLYKGTASGPPSDCTRMTWTWQHLLRQPRVAGIALSPLNPKIIYAASTQFTTLPVDPGAGIYKSVDGGATWSLLDNNGLTNLVDVVLKYSIHSSQSLVMYGATLGSGVFKAIILPPATPSGLTATAVPNRRINLSWVDNSKAEVGSAVERRRAGTTTWTEIFRQDSPNKTTHTDAGLQAGTTYFYRVRAYDEAGNSGCTNEASATAQR